MVAAILAFALERQADRHGDERELWRAERQILQARALRPMPSARRPAVSEGAAEAAEADPAAEKAAKMAQLRRLAAGLSIEEPRPVIIPTDL